MMRICDDYEILVRTFLHTKMCHVKYPCYMQRWLSGKNSQDGGGGVNRQDIQRRVDIVSNVFNEKIHDRMNELSGGLEQNWKPKSGRNTYQLYTPENCTWYVNNVWVPDSVELNDPYYKEKYGR